MHVTTRIALALTFTLLGLAPRTDAATVVAMNLEQMTDRSEMIFIGRVVGERADWSSDRRQIYTHVSFEVERYLKGGTEARTATVRLLGGRVGPYLVRLPGTPAFEPDEEVLLFCAGGGPAALPTVLGLSLGKFTVTRDAAGEAVVKRDISSLVLASYRTDSREPGELVHRYRLDDIEARIREYAR